MSRNPYLAEISAEILKTARMPEFMIPTLALPVMFYALFAIALPGAAQNAPYLLATFGIFAVMGPALFGFGAGVAQERDRGWLTIKRAAPAPAASFILAKTIATVLMAALSLAAMYVIAGFFAGVSFERGAWLALLSVHVLASIPFALIGLALGFLFGANAAVAIANIVFLGFAVLGGLWIPITVFPQIMADVAVFLPSYHLAEIALAVSGAPGDRAIGGHVLVVLGMTAGFAVLAGLAWARQR